MSATLTITTQEKNYKHIEQYEYSFNTICKNARASFQAADTALWDGLFWTTQAIKLFGSASRAAKELAKELNISKRWIMRGMQVYRKFHVIKDIYPELTYQHFICAVTYNNNEAIKWLDKANVYNWSSSKLYFEMHKNDKTAERAPLKEVVLINQHINEILKCVTTIMRRHKYRTMTEKEAYIALKTYFKMRNHRRR